MDRSWPSHRLWTVHRCVGPWVFSPSHCRKTAGGVACGAPPCTESTTDGRLKSVACLGDMIQTQLRHQPLKALAPLGTGAGAMQGENLTL